MNIHFVKIIKNKNDFQFFYEGLPIHSDKLIQQLKIRKPDLLNIQVQKNEKIFWDAYYLIKKEEDIEKYLWKAFKMKV